jgi:hypothetical protein
LSTKDGTMRSVSLLRAWGSRIACRSKSVMTLSRKSR